MSNTELEIIYDEVAHEFDEQVVYMLKEEFPNYLVFKDTGLSAWRFHTEHKEVMRKLLRRIKASCICITSRGLYYIVERDTLIDILNNFPSDLGETE